MDQGGPEIWGEIQKRAKETIQLYLHPWTDLEDEHLANFYAISS